ncbi:MAG: TIGR01212 family radical SAM protein [Bacteroidetes bacterium GWE2_29_8]|nr:MAG: TIGR01212 family radical SAM protein [Bacteroidetes bacterium GWE2_29_8]
MDKNRYFWETNRPFNSYSEYCKKKYGTRLQKVSIDAGFTCPNRDGSKGFNGCIYCNNKAFNPSYCDANIDIKTQIDEGITFHKVRYRKAEKYIAYFQTYSNTYSSLENLKHLYNQALQHPMISGITIATRPDCINTEILNVLKEIEQQNYIVNLEIGIEACDNKTLKEINRGHTFEDTIKALYIIKDFEIPVCAHLIFGLPYQTKESMMQQAEIISKLPINSIKFHQLQIIKDTFLAKDYIENPCKYHLFELDEYIQFIIEFLEKLNPNIVIERLTGEVPPRFFAIPNKWGLLRNYQLINIIEKEMLLKNSFQGKYI